MASPLLGVARTLYFIGDAGCASNALMAPPLSGVSLLARLNSSNVGVSLRARWDTSLVVVTIMPPEISYRGKCLLFCNFFSVNFQHVKFTFFWFVY